MEQQLVTENRKSSLLVLSISNWNGIMKMRQSHDQVAETGCSLEHTLAQFSGQLAGELKFANYPRCPSPPEENLQR